MKRLIVGFIIGLGSLLGFAETSNAQQSPVTAIDIALEPDETMIQHAQAVNAQLRKNHPKGFALDASHRPHITILQRYVRSVDLDNVYAAVNKVLEKEKVDSWQLKAFEYDFIPFKGIGIAGIGIQPTDNLLRLQQELIDAVAPFTEETGTAAAFVTTPEDSEINQPTIDYVAAFVPRSTGQHFVPHVTVGVATQLYLEEMLAEPFEAFTFSPTSASVYQLGNFGTARKKLKSF